MYIDVGGKKTDSKPNKWHEDLIIPKGEPFVELKQHERLS